jgi:hypothetical protein
MTLAGVNPLLERRPVGGISRVEQDREIFEFINGLDRYYSINELRGLIIEKFGEKRAPSKSGLGRFLTNITREAAKKREDGHGK